MDWKSGLLFPIFVSSILPGYNCFNQEARLVNNLIKGYEKSSRPVQDSNDVVNLTLDVALNQILDLDERNQILRTTIWLRMRWTDEFFKWNISDYGGLNILSLESNRLWHPSLALWNNAGNEFSVAQDTLLKVSSDGIVQWNSPAVVQSACRIDVKYFPFDEQRCSLTFGSWTLHGSQMDIDSLNDIGDVDNFVDNGEWFLVGFPVKKVSKSYGSSREPFPTLTYTIIIRRRSLYYVYNLVFPIIMISMITMLDFYLPPESGEKVSLGVTVLLAMIVYLMIISESMPPTSEVVPLIGQFFGATIVMLGLSVTMTVIVLHIHFKGTRGKPIPTWMRHFFLEKLARMLGMHFDIKRHECKRGLSSIRFPRTHFGTQSFSSGKFKQTFPHQSEHGELEALHGDASQQCFTGNNSFTSLTNLEKVDNPYVMAEMLQMIANIEHNVALKLNEESNQDGINKDWQLVAMVIDRMFLILFFSITVIVSLAILCSRPASIYI